MEPVADMPAIEPVGPWGAADAAAPVPDAAPVALPEAAAAPAPRSRRSEFVWNLISTLLLAGWIAFFAGPLAALALVTGIFVHEFGHMLVINWAGAGPSRLRIIPFFGGAATMARAPDSDFKGVLISLAGPVFGLLTAVPFFVAAQMTGQPAWLGGAFYVGALNLINLAPAAPLDGSKAAGPVLARIHPLLERGALLAVALAALIWAVDHHSWLFALVIALGALRAFTAGALRVSARPLNSAEWAASLALYVGAVALCAWVTLAAADGAGIVLRLPSFGGLR